MKMFYHVLLCLAVTGHTSFSNAQSLFSGDLDLSDVNTLTEQREAANYEHRKLLPPCKDLPAFDPSADVETVVSFYALGDTPYSGDQYYCLNEQLRGLNITDGAALFTLNVGDIKRGAWPCNYSAYNDIAKMYYHPNNAVNYDPRDAFFVVGDNEFSDCNDPEAAWALWTEHFGMNNRFGFGTFSPGKNIAVERQTNAFRLPGVDRSENFAFFTNEVLFIGLNIIGGDAYGDESVRLVQNFQWTRDKMAQYKTQGMKACFVFGHSPMQIEKGDRRLYFGEDFLQLLRTEYPQLPVMYVHGDWHDYCIRNADKENDNFWDLELEDGGFAPPVLVSVVRNKDPNDDRYLFKVDQRGGLYSPLGECNKIYEVTWGEQAPEPDPSTPIPTGMFSTMIPTPTPTPTSTPSPTMSSTVPQSTQPPTMSPTQPQTPSSSDPELFTFPWGQEQYPLGECQGDCNKNSHCQPGLRCFKRDDLSPVPGCSGLGRSRKDYCIVAPDNELKFVAKFKRNPEKFPLGKCEGYCWNDVQCAGTLKCFKRNDLTPVPGCIGSGKSGKNYCYDDTA